MRNIEFKMTYTYQQGIAPSVTKFHSVRYFNSPLVISLQILKFLQLIQIMYFLWKYI